ncbi:hypothetical protein HZA99_06470 [Candidatus Woesearchaeota archaeon]|nr:hypothetical protein [Candidatus Woesearchaeota archaeon]
MEWIKARVIIEMLGAPKEHIQQTLEFYIEKLKKDEKKIVIKSVEYVEPKEVNNLFSVFAELEIEFEDLPSLTYFCFDYMPSSIEIHAPDELIYDRNEYTNFLNDLQARLHKVDMLMKNLSAENKVVKKNGNTLARNIVVVSLESGPKALPEISRMSGMPEEHIKKFVNILVSEGKVKEADGKYQLPKKS